MTNKHIVLMKNLLLCAYNHRKLLGPMPADTSTKKRTRIKYTILYNRPPYNRPKQISAIVWLWVSNNNSKFTKHIIDKRPNRMVGCRLCDWWPYIVYEMVLCHFCVQLPLTSILPLPFFCHTQHLLLFNIPLNPKLTPNSNSMDL